MIKLIDRISSTPGCRALPQAGKPTIAPEHQLPPDLDRFYAVCGGVDLFGDQNFPIHISSATELVPSNPAIVGTRVADDISDSWYIVASGGGGEFLSIDLHPARLGTCYDSFREVHGVPGSCAVVARSFTELVERLLDAHGGHWYWLAPDFQPLGDAYDVVR